MLNMEKKLALMIYNSMQNNYINLKFTIGIVNILYIWIKSKHS